MEMWSCGDVEICGCEDVENMKIIDKYKEY